MTGTVIQSIQFADGDGDAVRMAKLRRLAESVQQIAQQINQTNSTVSSATGASTTQPYLVYKAAPTLTNSALLAANSPIVISGGNTVGLDTAALLLEQLGDVSVTTPANGQVLTYKAGEWVNQSQSSFVINWNQITNTPTTLEGYGITDAVSDTVQIIAGQGLAGGGALTGNVTLRLAAPQVVLFEDNYIAEDAAYIGGPGTGGAGTVGPQGPQGIQGPAAPTVFFLADDGNDGDDGRPGYNGATGQTGAQGPAGAAIALFAEDGPEGDQGPVGPAGAQGAQGATGPTGPALFMTAEDGPEGDIGPPGATGAQGPQGAQGAQGPAGPALFIMANDGEDGDTFAIPGPQGPQGPQGPSGGGSSNATGAVFIDPDASGVDDVLVFQPPGKKYNVKSWISLRV